MQQLKVKDRMFDIYGPKGIVEELEAGQVIMSDFDDLMDLKVKEIPDSLTAPPAEEEIENSLFDFCQDEGRLIIR